jgi:hypothetical protein
MIEQLILSAELHGKLVATGLARCGSYHPTLWAPFDTVKSVADQASDHQLRWADFPH